MTEVSTETEQPKKKPRGRPFKKGRDARRKTGATKPASTSADVRAFSQELISDPKVRAALLKKARRGELSAPLLKNLMERAAGIVKDAAEPEETDWQRRVREKAAEFKKSKMSRAEALMMYRLSKKSQTGRWPGGWTPPPGMFDDARPEPKAEPAQGDARPGRPPVEASYLRTEDRVSRAEVATALAARALPEPERGEVIDLVPEGSPRDWREEQEWRRHLVRCSDPRSCKDGASSHPSHAWRRLTRLT